jgi:stage II sporulation protein R
MKEKIKSYILLLLLFIIFIIITINSYATTVFNDLSESFFRLHILANSDNQIDQELKLKVRDNVLEYMREITKNISSKNEAINICNSNLENFKEIALKTIKEEGFDYSVNVNIGNFKFPTKHYGNISLPAGNYDALRIEIGAANGQNWWCSLFPPLCFVDMSSGIIDETSENVLKENLSEEDFAIISSDSEDIHLKFKIIEFLNEKNIL